MGISFKDAFKDIFKVTGQVLKGVAVQEVSKIPAVQEEIETQKTLSGKNLLWSIFPIIFIFGVVFFLFRGR